MVDKQVKMKMCMQCQC